MAAPGRTAKAKQPESLNGWQKIVDFLGQPTSVAQRWARSGMPVIHEGRHVQASPDQLNRWLGRGSAGEPVQIATETADLTSELKRRLSYVRRRALPTKRNERREGGRLGTRRDHDSRKVKRSLCRSWFRLNWESSLLPCLQSALKSPHVFVSTLLKFLRQTGARALIWSSAVRDDWFVLGDTRKVVFEFV
jgi:hypothetical protein